MNIEKAASCLICLIRVSEGGRGVGQKNTGRNNGQMFIMDEENVHIQEAQGSPSRRNIKKNTPKCTSIKLLKGSDKDKNLKAAGK